jgi:tetratricopeptide (TPR) repeat protein
LFQVLQEDHDVDLSRKGFYQDHPKLQERAAYTSKLAASIPPHSANPMVEANQYLLETETAVRHDADLDIRAGRARTAVWVMERIVKRDDKLADNFCILGEAYRGLGARTPEPKPEELASKGKEKTRSMLSKMTPQEYEAALLNAPSGRQALESNEQLAEKNYRRALDISPNFAEAHRGLGFLYEEEQKRQESSQEFKKYLDLAPSGSDSPRIKKRLDAMEKEASHSAQTSGGN